ncbi:3-methyl-2-oxobutanoate hydroxymethyltransferase [Tengunoibacter tsumagoiensis]|uniref:3-methyl-2-oxobutanoate hydroxymethyltransferase n=1 Tax=Tengunoibacter tsumagoiensis TaxID=2014871 RepID=A0A402A2X2_9CHLR|nr:3-methyl-2-oxobutanoate hydroxymethyltransferase [Tengunoibacter tsumagoiensis]GCE13399.1 3-methyl-2-oxobutanoate hydroxymethyltransferase [Tengunoibacter tsumagoiensis]
MSEKITVPMIRARKQGPKISMVTAYDASMAQIVDRAGVDMILVGDSVATTVQGHEDTLSVTLDQMVYHAAAVNRARPHCLVVVDLPWLSYHISPEETVRNAGRLVQEGHADAVKLEGGRKRLSVIKALVNAEIPVVGHLGLTPQSVLTMGGFRVQGRDLQAAKDLIADAQAIAQAGVFAIVLEGIPDSLAALITQSVNVPTIGIGAGAQCDGQVLVYHDVLGLNLGHLAKFVREFAQLAHTATEALQAFHQEVQAGSFPTDKESYHFDKTVLQALQQEQEPVLDE